MLNFFMTQNQMFMTQNQMVMQTRSHILKLKRTIVPEYKAPPRHSETELGHQIHHL